MQIEGVMKRKVQNYLMKKYLLIKESLTHCPVNVLAPGTAISQYFTAKSVNENGRLIFMDL